MLFEYVAMYMQDSQQLVTQINKRDNGKRSDRAILVCFILSVILLTMFYIIVCVKMYANNKLKNPLMKQTKVMILA